MILESLQNQVPFTHLLIEANSIDDASIPHLVALCKRKVPDHLQELHLIHAKIMWRATLELLGSINRQNSLRRLSLVNSNLNAYSMRFLIELVKNSKSLISLNISWNSLLSEQMMPLLETLSTNRRLQDVNLSWNNIQEARCSDTEREQILLYLGKMIKHNKSL